MIFDRDITHVCSLRTVLTMLAKAMHEGGVEPGDREAIRAINVEVARKVGFLPATGLVALGHKRPAGRAGA